MRIRFVIFALAATLMANSVHAEPSYLKESVVIDGAFVHLGDIFGNVGDRGMIAIARAPAPGKHAVYEVRQLAAIARNYGVEWRAKSWFDRVVIKRDSIVIGLDEIESELLKEIRRSGLRGEWEIMLRNRRFTLTLPADQPATLAITNLNIDQRLGRFTATVAAPAGHPTPTVRAVNGRLFRIIEIPTMNRRIGVREVIRKSDIEWIKMRSEKVNRNVVVDAEQLIGKTPRRSLRPGQPIRSGDVRTPIIVTKGSLVTMVLRTGNMVLTSRGKAVENGSLHEAVRVMNTKSKTVVEAIVTSPNMVRVVTTVQLP